MHKTLLIAAINGLLAVLLGAFGAHALETRVPPDLLEVWGTAVQYQMFHTTAFIALALLQREHPEHAALQHISRLVGAGIGLFCGGL